MAHGSTLRILICIANKHYSKNSKTADNASFYDSSIWYFKNYDAKPLWSMNWSVLKFEMIQLFVLAFCRSLRRSWSETDCKVAWWVSWYFGFSQADSTLLVRNINVTLHRNLHKSLIQTQNNFRRILQCSVCFRNYLCTRSSFERFFNFPLFVCNCE